MISNAKNRKSRKEICLCDFFSCIFAEDKAALGNLKASFHCARLHYLCMTINKLNFRKYEGVS